MTVLCIDGFCDSCHLCSCRNTLKHICNTETQTWNKRQKKVYFVSHKANIKQHIKGFSLEIFTKTFVASRPVQNIANLVDGSCPICLKWGGGGGCSHRIWPILLNTRYQLKEKSSLWKKESNIDCLANIAPYA